MALEVGNSTEKSSASIKVPILLGVVDTHLHLQNGELTYPWVDSGDLAKYCERISGDYTKPASGLWSEVEFMKDMSSGRFQVSKGIFVECGHSAMSEAKWALTLAESKESIVQGVVAHIDVSQGASQVQLFLAGLQNKSGLPSKLKGGRVVLLGDPRPRPEIILEAKYLEGLKELNKAGLHWEWCCHPEALPNIAKVCASLPDMVFVLDHLGHNSGGDDLSSWKKNIAAVAASSKNVFAKLGAIEEWGCKDPAPYLDHALRVFGFDRVLYEGNWFVSAGIGNPYARTAEHVYAACLRAKASVEQTKGVFTGNAMRVYRI